LSSTKKKVLVISYYFPPEKQADPYPTYSWVKYLGEYGWEPVVLTREWPGSRDFDRDAGINVHRTPYKQMYPVLIGLKKKMFGGRMVSRLINFILQNFLLYPDSQKGWYVDAYPAALEIIRREKIDVIISVSTPWTAHLIADALNRSTGVPWVADYRDPWTQDIAAKKRLKWIIRNRVSRAMEKKVCASSSQVIHASKYWAENLSKLLGRKVHDIPNGFDLDDFKDMKDEIPDEEVFTISYIGSLHFVQETGVFLDGFRAFIDRERILPEKCRILFVGSDNIDRIVKKDDRVKNYIKSIRYVPKKEAISYMMKSHVLLLFMSHLLKGWYPTKVFEYLAAGRPILATPDDEGVIKRLLKNNNFGVALTDPVLVADWLSGKFKIFQKNSNNILPDKNAVKEYNRKNLTSKLAEILNRA